MPPHCSIKYDLVALARAKHETQKLEALSALGCWTDCFRSAPRKDDRRFAGESKRIRDARNSNNLFFLCKPSLRIAFRSRLNVVIGARTRATYLTCWMQSRLLLALATDWRLFEASGPVPVADCRLLPLPRYWPKATTTTTSKESTAHEAVRRRRRLH